MTEQQVSQILSVHLPGVDGLCAGCRWWWARLAPYPCYQAEWALRRHARVATGVSWTACRDDARSGPADLELRRLRLAVALRDAA